MHFYTFQNIRSTPGTIKSMQWSMIKHVYVLTDRGEENFEHLL
jgi:carbonic anhydrase